MAYSYVQYTGNGATTNYAFSFPYIDPSHIKVRVNGVITSYTYINSGTIQISPAPLAGRIIDIRRETPKDLAPVNFTDGSVLLEQDLDLLAAFSLYTAQESSDGVADSITKDTLGVWDAQSRRMKGIADPINANDAVNKTWAETAMSSQLASATTQATLATTKASEASASASSASTSASTATTKASEANASATSASNSATSATASASTATTKATEALASQVASAASAVTASTKAGEATTSAGSAASSASTATTQAGIATTQATNASNSASNAATSASTATTKADSATASATAAAGSAATATTKAAEADADATSAGNSASNAATSASNAANSATLATTNGAAQVTLAAAQVVLATTQANNSASSATASANSATASANSATSAAASAASAAAILDNFDDRYLGTKSSAPTVDNDGNALQLGALYFDSTTGKMRVYTASGWLDASSASVATLANYQFNATGGQTTFSGTAAVGGTLTYTIGAVMVALNGVLLESPSEFTASNGTSIVLASGASTGDELNVYAFGNFLVADTYSRAEADAKYVPNTSGAINIGNQVYKDASGNIGVGISSITTSGSRRTLQVTNGASGGMILLGNSATENPNPRIFLENTSDLGLAAGVTAGVIKFYTNDTERIRIDSAGRVKIPSQPAASASWNNVINPGSIVPADAIHLNIGSCLNSSGRFTAPIAGTYFYSFCGMNEGLGSDGRIELNINGGGISSNFVSYNRGAYARHALFGYLNLAAGDYVEFRVTSGSYNQLHPNHGMMNFRLES